MQLLTYSFIGNDYILFYCAKFIGNSLNAVLQIQQQRRFPPFQLLNLLIEGTFLPPIPAIQLIQIYLKRSESMPLMPLVDAHRAYQCLPRALRPEADQIDLLPFVPVRLALEIFDDVGWDLLHYQRLYANCV